MRSRALGRKDYCYGQELPYERSAELAAEAKKRRYSQLAVEVKAMAGKISEIYEGVRARVKETEMGEQ